MARILAVDDEPAIRSLLERTLAKDGHDVRCAACAEEALAARPERYDLVLLDVMMPGMDGFELCGRIRTLTDAPIVFLTAKAAEEDAVFGLGMGGDDYVRKPFGAAELYVGEARVPLTKTEFDVCEFLARHPGQVFSRDQIVEGVFGWDAESDAATISVHVSNARAKLKAAGAEPVQTVWGVGYRWTA